MYIPKVILRGAVSAIAFVIWASIAIYALTHLHSLSFWQSTSLGALGGVFGLTASTMALLAYRTWILSRRVLFAKVEAMLRQKSDTDEETLSYNRHGEEYRIRVKRDSIPPAIIATISTEIPVYNPNTMRTEEYTATTIYCVDSLTCTIDRFVGVTHHVLNDNHVTRATKLDPPKVKLSRVERSLAKRAKPTQDELALEVIEHFTS